MPRVLILTDDLENGGAERQLALFVKYLPPEWDRRVFSFSSGPYTKVLQDMGIRVDVHLWKTKFDLRPTAYLWRTILNWRPEVVHSWGWMGTAIASLLCRFLHIPLIDGSIRNGIVSLRRERARRWSMRGATCVIANSQAGLEVWRMGSVRGRVVYNGFDPDRLPMYAWKRSLDCLPTVVIMTGRMASQKDYRTFFAAARRLIKRDEQGWRFVAVGNGPDKASFISETSELIQAGKLIFPEGGLEVLNLVKQAHIGVLASNPAFHAEGCSNSIMEYMACGLPVVCSDSGGNRELVLQGQTGFIVPPSDPIALADKLEWLKNHPEIANQLGQAGRERIFRDFSVSKMIEKTLAVYQEVMRM